jgi:hypothetical protein
VGTLLTLILIVWASAIREFTLESAPQLISNAALLWCQEQRKKQAAQY